MGSTTWTHLKDPSQPLPLIPLTNFGSTTSHLTTHLYCFEGYVSSLLKSLDDEHLHHDVFEFAKHKCVTFPISNKKKSFLFTLIHNDI